MPNLITEDVTPEVTLIATAGQTSFTYPFAIFDAGDILVLVNGTETSPLAVLGVGDAGGGTVTLAAQSAGATITLRRSIPIKRSIDIPATGPYAPEIIDDEFDRVFAIMQDVRQVQTAALDDFQEQIDELAGGAIGAGLVSAQRRQFTATAGQTVFSFLVDALTDHIGVYVNGVRLATSDYTHSGANITLASGLAAGDIVLLEGYTTTADAHSTAAQAYTNSVTGAGSRSVQAKLDEWVSVKDFGAKGDGSTDDHAAISAAITAAYSANKGIFFPTGPYRISQTLQVSLPGLRMRGDGYCIIRNTGTGPVVAVDATVSTIEYGIHLENFVLEGNGAASQDGLYIQNIGRSSFRNIHVRNVTRYAFHLLGVVQTHFDTCLVSEDLTYTYVPLSSWYITGSGDNPSASPVQPNIGSTTNCTFTNCTGKVATEYGWYLHKCDGCAFTSCAGEGLYDVKPTVAPFTDVLPLRLSGAGLRINAKCVRNVFTAFFAESNSVRDLELLGEDNLFLGCTFNTRANAAPYISKESVRIRSGALRNKFVNCQAFAVVVDAGAQENDLGFVTLAEEVGEVGITNNGTRSRQYRKGTLATTFGGTSSNGIYVLSAGSYGSYVQEGLIVRGEALIDVASISSGATGDAAIINVFPAGATPRGLVTGQIQQNNLTMPGGHIQFLLYREGTETRMRIRSRATGSGSGTGIPTIAGIQYAYITWSYEVA